MYANIQNQLENTNDTIIWSLRVSRFHIFLVFKISKSVQMLKKIGNFSDEVT